MKSAIAAILIAFSAPLLVFAQADPLADLARRLGAEEFATRSAAQKELDALPNQQLPALQRLVTTIHDPEVLSRIQPRLAVMEEETAYDPPPLSLSINRATLDEMRTALARAAGVPITPPGGGGGGYLVRDQDRFTLDMKDCGFWEILEALDKQGPLQISTGSNGDFALIAGTGLDLRHAVKKGGFLIAPHDAQLNHRRDFQANVGTQNVPPMLRLTYSLMADPRICIAATTGLYTREVRDENGTLLYFPKGPPRALANPAERVLTESIDMAISGKASPRRVTLKGEASFIIGLGSQRVEIPDVYAVHAPIEIGTESIEIHLSEGVNNWLTLTKKPPALAPRVGLQFPVDVTLYDAQGNALPLNSVMSPGEIDYHGTAKPVKAVFTTPLRLKEVRIEYELKDLVLP